MAQPDNMSSERTAGCVGANRGIGKASARTAAITTAIDMAAMPTVGPSENHQNKRVPTAASGNPTWVMAESTLMASNAAIATTLAATGAHAAARNLPCALSAPAASALRP